MYVFYIIVGRNYKKQNQKIMPFRVTENLRDKKVYKEIQDDDIELYGEIHNRSDVTLISTGETSIIGRIDDSTLTVISETEIKHTGNLDGSSSVKLISKQGNVTVNEEINGSSSLAVEAAYDITLKGNINGSSSINLISKYGNITIHSSDINGSSRLTAIAEGDIIFNKHNGDGADINGSSFVELISTRGSITIDGHVDGSSTVRLTAFKDITIHEIDDSSSVISRSNGKIILNGKIDGDSYAEFRANEGILITDKVSGNSLTKLATNSGEIRINNNIEHGGKVIYWPSPSFQLGGSGSNSATAEEWVSEYDPSIGGEIEGSWWNNWFWSYGFVSYNINKPKTLEELIEIVKNNQGNTIKAVGGGWSFSDINLPLQEQNEVSQVSIFGKGKGNSVDLSKVFRHMNNFGLPMDNYPQEVARSLNHSSDYNLNELRNDVRSGVHLQSVASTECVLIDTRGLNSSLQCHLGEVNYEDSFGKPYYRFWVEAGITMTDLNKLLDHQSPRMAIEASGGSPGATLAGTLATATHGGEYKDKLLVDRIKAVHLVAPNGEQWWIEGKDKVMEEIELKNALGTRNINIINNATTNLSGLTSEDFLKTVVVSLGAIGIAYSIVLDVVPQFTVRQKTIKYCGNENATGWQNLLSKANVSISDLENRDSTANERLVNFLKDGSLNGTGIPEEKNRYVDLAINPLSYSSWIVNREFFEQKIAIDKNQPTLFETYPASLTQKMTEGADSAEMGGQLVGRILDFMSLPRDTLGLAITAGHIPSFPNALSNSPMLLSALMSHLQVKAMWNQTNESDKRRGHKFLDDILEGILDALQNTYEEVVSDFTGLSYEVGAIGWPDGGFPGRGYEVALPSTVAFSYTVEIMRLIENFRSQNKVFLGYISIRLCPKTNTLFGMQQFEDSVMVEVVAHRTPQANEIFDELINYTKSYNITPNFSTQTFPMFHWGLETELFDGTYLENTILGEPYSVSLGMSRLDVFKFVKDYIRKGEPPIFDNAFLNRMGLNS
ncbi:FAD-dependent oxidoreductase [Aquimarina sp. ERC-38]|uniref:FAD-binding protein n=1 Tax=Aquimarina sp. ERC-38 TaxID=2949996 RepID=UPI002247D647|nr:FAD-binding protein [Aquimarina sp. ERC-38]UZO82380.1 FAD-dependent oxidoreductase [Aquimarina sp. ERC-38]